jgi:hypothetical protein
MNREQLQNKLKEKYPKLKVRTTEEFDGGKGGLWVSGEDGIEAKDGFSLFDYYAEDYKEVRYIFGVHKEIGDYLEANGWYAEWYDAGTIMIYSI